MFLSDHFTLDEMTHTDHADLQEQNRAEAVAFIPMLKRVSLELGEPIRALFDGVPINVHSAYRCPALNDAVGSQSHSQHLLGEAMDFDIIGYTNSAAINKIMTSGIKFHQLLIERGCLHVGLPKPNMPNGEVAYWYAGEKNVMRQAV
jgi:hypothetical protein